MMPARMQAISWLWVRGGKAECHSGDAPEPGRNGCAAIAYSLTCQNNPELPFSSGVRIVTTGCCDADHNHLPAGGGNRVLSAAGRLCAAGIT